MRQKTALLFDDNKMCRDMLTDALAEMQLQVVAFSDPISFLRQQEKICCHRISEPCYDILLTDNNMPGMTGLEFLEKLQEVDCKISAHHMAIISGKWEEADLLRAKKIGCKIFHKPTPLDEIYDWLNECG